MGQKKKVIAIIIVFFIVAATAIFIYSSSEKIGKILLPFFFGMIIAYLLHPVVLKLERKKINRKIGIILLYLLFLLTTATSAFYVIPEIISNIKDLIVSTPQIASKYQDMFNGFMAGLQTSGWPDEIKNTAFREINNGIGIVQEKLIESLRNSLEMLLGAVTAIFDLVLAMIIAYYLIKDAEFFKEALLSMIPRSWRNEMISGGREINHIMSNFIQGQLLTALIVGLLETLGLMIVHVKYPLILGFIGGVANIIPYFGPILGAIPAVALSLIDSPMKALWAAAVFAIVQQIDNAFISPKIIEGRLGLHPITTILAVLVGGEFFGITGLLVAVPVAAILKVTVKRIIEAIV